MPTMAQWGSKKWAVSSKQVVALEGLAFSYEQVADENTSTEDKKTTNERGTELFPLSFTTVLHSGAGVDVWAEIQSWKALVTKVNYFYLGGKKLGPKLQLRKVAVSNTKVDGKGRLLLATLSFTFKEYDPATTSVKVNVVVMATFPTLDSIACTINASRLIDTYGEQAAYQQRTINKVAGQGTMIKITIPIYEVTA